MYTSSDIRGCNIRGLNRAIKRAFDVVVGGLALVAAAPVMLLVAALVKLTSRGPVLFAQDRIGEGGVPFRFYKFRSMTADNDDAIHRAYVASLIQDGAAADADGAGEVFKLTKDPRLTVVGGFLRRYSLDELPQLFNVLRGDMSLIGPRPPLDYEVELYEARHRRRLEGPPGITGLWQVSGRSRIGFEEMVALDVEYLESWSLRRDLVILWRTVSVVLFDKAY